MSELFGPPFCISILKVSQTQNLCHLLAFNVFCMIQEYFLRVFKFLQVKEGDLISGGNQFSRMTELFGPPFCISILIFSFFQTQILRHLLASNAFCMIQKYFSQGFQICAN